MSPSRLYLGTAFFLELVSKNATNESPIVNSRKQIIYAYSPGAACRHRGFRDDFGPIMGKLCRRLLSLWDIEGQIFAFGQNFRSDLVPSTAPNICTSGNSCDDELLPPFGSEIGSFAKSVPRRLVFWKRINRYNRREPEPRLGCYDHLVPAGSSTVCGRAKGIGNEL